MVPTREIFWNVGDLQTVVYLLASLSILIAIYGTARHWRQWSLGTKGIRVNRVGARLTYFFRFVFGHTKILQESFPGVMHLLVFWGFFVLFLGTLTIAFQEDLLHPLFGKKILLGNFYLFYSLLLDLSGLLAIVGVGMAIYRRYVLRPRRLDNRPSNIILLGLLLCILITGFLVEGLRIYVSQPRWGLWEPLGWLSSKVFGLLGPGKSTQEGLHKGLWWIHLIASMGLIAYLPFSDLFHVFTSSLNVLLRSFEPRGALAAVDFSRGQPFGVAQIKDFTRKHLLDLDACTRCGRCQESCPAYLSEKPLNPKKIILDLKDALHRSASKNGNLLLAGRSVSEDELWSCTTCHACVEACPVFVEPVEKIVDLRRYLVMEQGSFPPEVKKVFKNLETYGDTYGRGPLLRAEWTSGLPVETVKEGSKPDVLFWAGCEGALNDRTKEVIKGIVKVLHRAGVSVGVLGKGETCCGDFARRTGNEYLFQELARTNIENLSRCGIETIVAYCPHCFHTLKNEYPPLGGHFAVIHYTEYIAQLLREDRLDPQRPVQGVVTFQDPCYLGRVNGLFDPPREILRKIPGLVLKEMDRSREKSFCCGGGGGRIWMHEHQGKRINYLRAREAVETGADRVATACPYCLTMFEDGVRNQKFEKTLRPQDMTVDVAEILYRSLG